MKNLKELYQELDDAMLDENMADKDGRYEDWKAAREKVYNLENLIEAKLKEK